MKSLMIPNEKDIFKQMKKTILENFQNQILINETSAKTGNRRLEKKHSTYFIIYNGTTLEEDPKHVKIIGETWNCEIKGASIISLGISYITNGNNTNIDNWKKIVMDPSGTIENHIGDNGLIYNVKCH